MKAGCYSSVQDTSPVVTLHLIYRTANGGQLAVIGVENLFAGRKAGWFTLSKFL